MTRTQSLSLAASGAGKSTSAQAGEATLSRYLPRNRKNCVRNTTSGSISNSLIPTIYKQDDATIVALSIGKDVCARKDDFTEPLRETAYADGIVFASPMYFFQITAQLRAFIERLFFPWLSYKDYSTHPPKGRIPTAFIYTMNAGKEHLHLQENNMNENEMIIGNALEKPERILAVNTLQVKNYDRYDMQGFNLEAKQRWHEEHWQEELQNAFDAGKRMAEKIMG